MPNLPALPVVKHVLVLLNNGKQQAKQVNWGSNPFLSLFTILTNLLTPDRKEVYKEVEGVIYLDLLVLPFSCVLQEMLSKTSARLTSCLLKLA